MTGKGPGRSAPREIGKYQLGKVLGKGASATVYLALDTFSGQEVAVKVLDPEMLSGPEVDKTHLKQFLNEASLAGRLSHPHIAAILEAAIHEDSGYIAIEYVPGGNLSQFTSPERLLPAEEIIEIAFKACGALDYAFKQGIVHRDIKPANIMLLSGTNIKVTDFGAAYLRKAEHTQVADVGSPLYMSPEQIMGRALGQHSDMFALGVVLYELLTGQRPFDAQSLPELFRRIVEDDPVEPSRLRGGISADLDRIILKMLRKAPEDRYASWADLALDLVEVGRLSVFRHKIPDVERFVSLRRAALLGGLTDAEAWELVHAAHWSRVPAHSVIMREGERGDSLFMLAGGTAKITKEGRLLNVLNAGEYFGEMAYVKGGAVPRQATAESMTDVLLAEFDSASLQQLSKDCYLKLTLALLNTLADRLAFTDARIVRALT
jgi:eukaryotic-like serine/threonine-protein kinase